MFRVFRNFSSTVARRGKPLNVLSWGPRYCSKLPFGVAAGVVIGTGIGYQLSTGINLNETRSDQSSAKDVLPTSLKSTLPLADLPVPEYADPIQFSRALDRIRELVGKENVSDQTDNLNTHTESPWMFRRALEGERAQAVVYPKNTDEVSAIVKICHEFRVPLVPYSGGTSLEGHFTPVYQGISLDMNRMSKILAINEKDMDIVVQPGVTYEEVNEAVRPYGLQFGPDPGPGAEIGGMIGTNASGTNAFAQGTMRANVEGLVVVLADGTIVRTRKRPRKSSAGYSLTDLVVGSEGTIGIVVEATLKLNPLPKYMRIGALSFPDTLDAAKMVESVLQSGHKLQAMELMDKEQMRLLNASGVSERPWDENDTLLLKFGGPTEAAVDRDIADIMKLSKQHNSVDLVFASTKEEGEELWAARKNALFAVLSSAPDGYKTIGTDTAVPVSQLTRFILEVQEEIKKRKLMGTVLGHVGDGNFHCCLAYDPKTEIEKVHDFVNWTAERSIELEGTCTGEHGIGMGKRKLLIQELGETAVDMMRQIKFALDPQLILNPGKIFSIQRVGDHGDDLPFHSCH